MMPHGERWATIVAVTLALCVGYWFGHANAEVEHRQRTTPIAVCPNLDSLIIHPTSWQREHGRLTRHITITCEVITR